MIRSFVIGLMVFALSAQGAFAFDLGGLFDAGKDAVKATTLSDDDVKAMAKQAKIQLDSTNPVAPKKDAFAKRFAKITKGMKTDKGLDLDMKVYLVKDINAFAMADGTVRVFAGLMKEMTDDEIRYVIGHEIGHVKLGHCKSSLQMVYATSAARKTAAASGNSVASTIAQSEIADFAEKLTHAQYSQANELEADKYALDFMKANKYNPKACVSALRKLEGMSGNVKSMFSSHPAPGDRATALEKEL